MPLASMASITSPEHGAQQECSRTFLWPPGGTRMGRSISVTMGVFNSVMVGFYLLLSVSDGLGYRGRLKYKMKHIF